MNKIKINKTLATDFIKEQFPQYLDLKIQEVEVQGVNNMIFRLGDELLCRLPTAAHYAHKMHKEQEVLSVIVTKLDVKIPSLIGRGKPSEIYPFDCSIYNF